MKLVFYAFFGGIALMLSIGLYMVIANHNLTTSVESAYDVKFIGTVNTLDNPHKLIIEKDGQRLTCDDPSAEDIKSKAPLTCDAPTPVTKIDAKQ